MPCIRFGGGIVCGPRIYRWRGRLFEVPSHAMPWPLRKDGEPFQRCGPVFWDFIDAWNKVKNKERYRVL